jgi:hypothetical protein
MSDPIPATYEAWRHCIEQECHIPLAADYVAARLAALGDLRGEEARRFRQCYGEAHWRRVVGWFERARGELSR